MKNTDLKFMQMAIIQAEMASLKNEVPIGAIIVANEQVIAKAHNLTETLCDPTAHAEMQAITAANNTLGAKYLKKCTIYVTVEPCPMCAGALRWAQMGRVVWGADDQKLGYRTMSEKMLHPKTIICNGVMELECRELIQNFFSILRPKIW